MAIAKTHTRRDLCMGFRSWETALRYVFFGTNPKDFMDNGESLKAERDLSFVGRYDARPMGNRKRDLGDHPAVRGGAGLPADPISSALVRVRRFRRPRTALRGSGPDSFRGRRRSLASGDDWHLDRIVLLCASLSGHSLCLGLSCFN